MIVESDGSEAAADTDSDFMTARCFDPCIPACHSKDDGAHDCRLKECLEHLDAHVEGLDLLRKKSRLKQFLNPASALVKQCILLSSRMPERISTPVQPMETW